MKHIFYKSISLILSLTLGVSTWSGFFDMPVYAQEIEADNYIIDEAGTVRPANEQNTEKLNLGTPEPKVDADTTLSADILDQTTNTSPTISGTTNDNYNVNENIIDEPTDEPANEVVLHTTTLSQTIGKYTITVSGDMPLDATLSAHRVYNTSELANIIDDEEYNLDVAFDIEIVSNGQTWQPIDFDKIVTLTVDNINVAQDEELVVYRIDDAALNRVDDAALEPDTIIADNTSISINNNSESAGSITENNSKPTESITENDNGKPAELITELESTLTNDGEAIIETEHFTVYTFGTKTVTTGSGETAAYLLSGPEFRQKLASLADISTITTIRWNGILTNTSGAVQIADISGDPAGRPVYAKRITSGSSTIIELYTDADIVYLNADSSTMFQNFTSLANLAFFTEYTDSSLVTDASYMFDKCSSLTTFDSTSVAFSTFNTANITNFSYIFNNCSALTSINLSNWDMSSGTNFDYMLSDCTSLTSIDMSSWDISAGTSFTNIMSGDTALKIVQSPSHIASQNIALPTGDWEITGDNTIYTAFKSNTTSSYTYYFIDKITTLLPGQAFNTAIKKLVSSSATYDSANSSITNIKFVTTDFRNENNIAQVQESGAAVYARKNDSVIELFTRAETINFNSDMSYMFANFTGVTELELLQDARIARPTPTNMVYIFKSCEHLQSLDLDAWDISHITSLSNVFNNCKALQTLHIANWNVSNVTSLYYTFASCRVLQDFELNSWADKVSKVTSLDHTFYYTNAANGVLNISAWDISHVTTFYYAFAFATINPTELANWGSKVTQGLNFSYMFYYAHTTNDATIALTLHDWQLTNATNLSDMFAYAYPSTIDLTGWTINKAENVSYMFANSSIKTLTIDNDLFQNCTNFSYMFAGCQKLTGTISWQNWDVSHGTNFSYMFARCDNVVEFDLSGWVLSTNTNTTISFTYMFAGYCPYINYTSTAGALKKVNLTDWNCARVTNFSYMFDYRAHIQEIIFVCRPASNATMSYMFYECNALQTLDVSQWDTSTITDMSSMFYDCDTFQTLDVSQWNVGSVTSMEYMFYSCSSLLNLDIQNWRPSKVTDMSYAFEYCSNMTEFIAPSWNLLSVTDLSYMFCSCSSLSTIDISQWQFNTSSSVSCAYMFSSCSALKSVDIANWNVQNISSFAHMFKNSGLEGFSAPRWKLKDNAILTGMFQNCTALTSVDIAAWDTSNISLFGYLFDGCTSLETLDLSNWHIKTMYDIPMFIMTCSSLREFKAPKTIAPTTVIYLPSNDWIITQKNGTAISTTQHYEQIQNNITDISYTYTKDVAELEAGSDAVLVSGKTFNTLIKRLYSSDDEYDDENSAITKIEWTDSNISMMPDAILVSETGAPVWACRSNGTVQLYTTASTVYFNADSSYLLSDFTQITDISALTNAKMSMAQCETIAGFFSNCKYLTNIDLNTWETTTITTFIMVFNQCIHLDTLHVESWDVSNGTRFDSMFYNCSSLQNVDLSSWKLTSATYVKSMFYNCPATDYGFERWDVSNIKYFTRMFESIKASTLDLSAWHMLKTSSTDSMLYNCTSLETFKAPATITMAITLPGSTSWYIDNDENNKADANTTSYAKTLLVNNQSNIYIKYQYYDITFDIEGDTELIPAQKVRFGNTLSKPADSAGFSISAWYMEPTWTSAVTFPLSINRDMTLYGKPLYSNYTVTFDPDGGNLIGSASKQVTYGSPYGTLPIAEKSGKYFNGWYYTPPAIKYAHTDNLNDDGSIKTTGGYGNGKNNNVVLTIPGAQSLHVTIVYQTESSSYDWVSIVKGTYSGSASDAQFNSRCVATLAGATKNTATYDITGYDTVTFAFHSDFSNCNYYGYYAVVTATNLPVEKIRSKSPVRIASDFTAHALYSDTATMLNVTYETNCNETLPATTAAYGSLLTAPTITRAHYDLEGWYADARLRTPYKWDFTTDRIDDDITLYAKWTPTKYNVSFNIDGAPAADITPQTITYNELATAPTVATRTGYTLSDWYKTSSSRDNTNKWNFDSDTVQDNTTLYAYWDINHYTVTFNTQGGSTVASQSVAYNDVIDTTSLDTSKTGHTFVGWFTDALDPTTQYDFTTPITQNMTLYAQWSVNLYDVTYYIDGEIAAEISNNPAAIEYNTSIAAAPAPTKTGYTLDGWYKSATNRTTNNKWKFGTSSSANKVLDDTNLYAYWEPNSYTVTFNANGGQSVSAQTVKYGQKVTEPTTTYTGYHLLGWHTAQGTLSNGTRVFDPATQWDFENDTMGAGNMTLYANWAINIYTVTFDTQGADDIDPQGVEHGQKVTKPADPHKDNCRFAGWKISGTNTKYDFNTPVTGPLTLIAQYKEIPDNTVLAPGPEFNAKLKNGAREATGNTANATAQTEDEYITSINLVDEPWTDYDNLSSELNVAAEGEEPVYARFTASDHPTRKHTVSYTRYAHTSNWNDVGTRTGNYTYNERDAEVIKIPGATSLHVELQYCTYYKTTQLWLFSSTTGGVIYVWQGSHSSTPTGIDMTGATHTYHGPYTGSGTQTLQHTSFDIAGDTVSFGFYSNANRSSNTSYGYYAVVTAEVEEPDGICTVDLFTEARNITLNDNSSYLLANMSGLTSAAFLENDKVNGNNLSNYSHMFQNDQALTSLDINWDGSGANDYSYMFAGCENLLIPDIWQNWTISNSADCTSMFANCQRLTSATLPGELTHIDTNMFAGCNNLTVLNGGQQVTSIGNGAFDTTGATPARLDLRNYNELTAPCWHEYDWNTGKRIAMVYEINMPALPTNIQKNSVSVNIDKYIQDYDLAITIPNVITLTHVNDATSYANFNISDALGDNLVISDAANSDVVSALASDWMQNQKNIEYAVNYQYKGGQINTVGEYTGNITVSFSLDN